MRVTASECVECANVRDAPASEQGPNGGRLQCKSCGRWVGLEHHPGCPVGQKQERLEAQVDARRVEAPAPRSGPGAATVAEARVNQALPSLERLAGSGQSSPPLTREAFEDGRAKGEAMGRESPGDPPPKTER